MINHNYNQIGATVVADSVNELGNRITTMILTMPRFLLAELNTHRMLSKNSASSRAIPFNKMVEKVKNYPFIPIAWQKDHKGMQGTNYFEGGIVEHHKSLWLKARDNAVTIATKMANDILYPDRNLTKQLCNRLLEPFMWHTVLITATEFENFSKLRCPLYTDPFGNSYFSKKEYINKVGDEEMIPKTLLGWLSINKSAAEIHISLLAESMYDAMYESTPKLLKAGEWHIPFGDTFEDTRILSIVDNFNVLDEEEQEKAIQDAKVKIATARCARISYNNFEGNDDYAADIKLYSTLLNQGHFSPFEHCARVMSNEEYAQFCITAPSESFGVDWETAFYEDEEQHLTMTFAQEGWCKNFRGFIQQRYFLETENN